MRSGCVESDGFSSGIFAKEAKHGGRDGEVEQGGADQAADDADSDRTENFFARFTHSDDEGNERDASRERGHGDRNKAL